MVSKEKLNLKISNLGTYAQVKQDFTCIKKCNFYTSDGKRGIINLKAACTHPNIFQKHVKWIKTKSLKDPTS